MAPAMVWSTSCGARAHQMQDTRIVTLLFTDMEGSTRLLGSLGDAFVPVIERQRAILTGAAAAHRGSGYRHRRRRLRVHLRLGRRRAWPRPSRRQRALAAEPWPGGTSVRVRMAIHAGEVADLGDELFGMALHQASRILGCHARRAGRSSRTRRSGSSRSSAPDISLLDLGTHRLRDIVRPVRLHQAVAEGIPTSFPPLEHRDERREPSAGADDLVRGARAGAARAGRSPRVPAARHAHGRRRLRQDPPGAGGRAARRGSASRRRVPGRAGGPRHRRAGARGRARGARHARAHGRAGRRASSCAPRWPTATSSSCSTTASTSSPGWRRS